MANRLQRPNFTLRLAQYITWYCVKFVIYNPKVICVTNNLRTYQQEGKHYISVNLFADEFSGQLEVKEKHKCEWWKWFALHEIPQPQFDASQFAIECFQKKLFYISNQM